MYRSSINIKHGCLSHLYWGQNKTSDEYIHIQDVKQNGLRCDCRCPVCAGDYIACMGEKNRPYFKHQSKYKCMYTDEITTYLRVKQILESLDCIDLPGVPVRLGMRFCQTPSDSANIDQVFYHCDEEQYPPLLMANIDLRPTRIVLAFEGYYTTEDRNIFRTEAENNKWDCLFISVPKIDVDDYISTAQLQKTVQTNLQDKEWIYSELEPYWAQRMKECVIAPAKVSSGVSAEAHDCPLHKQLYKEQYFASQSDCEKCQYNFGTGHNCLCAAGSGISCLSDFDIPTESRMYKVEELCSENEKAIADRKRAAELAEQAKKQEAEQRNIDFFVKNTCPRCRKLLKKMPGKKGDTWICVGRGCGFHAFVNHETGELIMPDTN